MLDINELLWFSAVLHFLDMLCLSDVYNIAILIALFPCFHYHLSQTLFVLLRQGPLGGMRDKFDLISQPTDSTEKALLHDLTRQIVRFV